MIYFGKSSPKEILRFGISFAYILKWVALGKIIPHLFIEFYFGHHKYWIGINRFKRIKKDKIYELDGVKYYKNKLGQYKRK